ncbi:MAG TPA: cell division protein ZapE [Pseudolabrys sp.]|jgi:cell division protein ZapE|nr:cell division protein ZapE [Pseudolabrys sp.]
MSDTFASRYAALVSTGKIEPDPAQADLVRRLVALEKALAQQRLSRKSSSLGWLFSRQQAPGPIKGLYVHGDVGRGKTMLMDLFFAASEVRRKRRAHFHEFMADVHERVREFRHRLKLGEIVNGDPIRHVADEIAEETWLLCFDEFHVTDIADAMILGRLFTRLFEQGVVLVATSNVAPDDLYKDGLNRALFLPFLDLLSRYVDVVRLSARTDYRMEKLSGVTTWYVPADEDAEVALDIAWQRLTGVLAGEPVDIHLAGRVLRVPEAAMGVARFAFAQLCEQPLGANDYLRLVREFHTLIVDRVPVMDYADRNAAKRFIILIDTLYDHAVKLIASAEAEPAGLYTADEGYEALEFRRTVSRLIEMRSQGYIGLPHGARAHADASGTGGIVET